MGRLRQIATGKITPIPQIRDSHMIQFKKHVLLAAIAEFCENSRVLFGNPVEFPMDWRNGQENADLEKIKRTYCASYQICDQLPEELKSRMGLPAPYTRCTVRTLPMMYPE